MLLGNTQNTDNQQEWTLNYVRSYPSDDVLTFLLLTQQTNNMVISKPSNGRVPIRSCYYMSKKQSWNKKSLSESIHVVSEDCISIVKFKTIHFSRKTSKMATIHIDTNRLKKRARIQRTLQTSRKRLSTAQNSRCWKLQRK